MAGSSSSSHWDKSNLTPSSPGWRHLGAKGVPDIGAFEKPIRSGGQFFVRKDGFWHFRNAPYGKDDYTPFGPSKTLYSRVTDPAKQNELDRRFIRRAKA